MTRFARYGYRKVGGATPWQELRKKAASDDLSDMDKLEARRAARRLRRQKGKVSFVRACGGGSAWANLSFPITVTPFAIRITKT